MSYNSTETAENYIGQAITEELLGAARAYIDSYSEYRWEETEISETFSGDGESSWLDLRAPIISVSSFEIDDTSQTESTDYELRNTEGRVRVYSGLPWGHDNIEITYTFGFTATSESHFYNATFPIVKMVEAQLALYFKKNPLKLKKLAIEGVTIEFTDDHLRQILLQIPTPQLNFTALGPSNLVESYTGIMVDDYD